MFRLPDASRRFFGLMILVGLLASLPPAVSSAGAQTRRARTRRGEPPVAKASPTPVVVPRLGAATQSPATPAARPTPTPAAPPSQNTQKVTPAPQATPAQRPTPAQSSEAVEDEDEVVRVTSNLVVVPVAVTGAGGEAVQGLKAADFRVEEEGRAQELAAVGDADQVPLDIALIFDISSSVTKNFEFQRQAAAGFLKQVLKPIDRAAVFTITEKSEMIQPLAAAEPATARLSTLQAAQKSTGTAFYDTVTAAARYLAQNAPERNRRVILVISDGEDNFSDDVRDATIAALDRADKTDDKAASEKLALVGDRTRGLHQKALQKVLREVQRADAVFYSINPSGPGLRLNVISQRAQDGMKMLADSTGGSSFVPDRLESLEAIFRQVAAELRAQYLLQYLSNNQAQPGKFLRIKVLTPARPDLRVRARQGYYKKG